MTTKPTVLLVDDEPAIHTPLKMLLARLGFETVSAHSSFEALKCIDERQFQLVITDYSMPEMNGLELAVAIKVKAPRTPIVLLTAYAEQFLAQAPITAIDMILPKPVSMQEFQKAIALVTQPAALG